MLKETFDKAKTLNRSILMMEQMKKTIETDGVSELFKPDFSAMYGSELIVQFKDELTKIISVKLEALQIEFDQL